MEAKRARVVLISPAARVALIRRCRSGREYWSLPGGGIRRGERPREAARREVAEELGLDVRPGPRLVVASGHALYVTRIDDEPPLAMRGPEARRETRRNRYDPQWVPLKDLGGLDVRPKRARRLLAGLLGEQGGARRERQAG